MKRLKKLVLLIAIFLLGLTTFGTEVKAASYPNIMLEVPYYPQKQSGDCGISSIAMIEAYALGYDKSSFDAVYADVYAANNYSFYINSACSNGRYNDISITLESFYEQLSAGNPILIRREPYEHWSVIVGYNGSSSTLEESGFIVWDTKTGVSACNYNEITTGRRFDLTRWLKAPNWNGSAYVDRGTTSLVRARVRGTGAIGGASSNNNVLSNTGVTNITLTSARINAQISPGANVSELGFYWGTDANSMTKKVESFSGYVEGIWYDLGTGKWTSALQPGTKYYYQIYAIINGVTYTTQVDSFTTTSTINTRVVDAGTSNITDTTARINAKVTPGANVTELGFYWGTNADSMSKKVESFSGYSESIWYDFGTGKWTSALQKGTKYYYQIYAIIDGITYKTNVGSFTTTGDSTNPTISNARVTNLTSDGYTVTCTVTDNVGVTHVCFPTWTELNGQDDLASDWYNNTKATNVSGSTYSFNVKILDHNNESGLYTTHIYAYDPSGNYTSAGVTAEVPSKQVLVTGIALNKSQVSITTGVTYALTATVTPTNATNKAITWSSSDTNVATVDASGNVTAIGEGQVTIKATAKDGSGISASCTITVAKPTEFPLVDGEIYKIRSVISGKLVEVPGGSTESALPLLQQEDLGTENQLWKVIKHDDGYSFISVLTNKAWDIPDASLNTGVSLTQWRYNETEAQRFRLIHRGDNKYSIHPVCSGLAIDVYGSSTENGTAIKQYVYHGRNNQLWTFELVNVVDPLEAFVTRMYQQCLSRDPDQSGLDGWVGQLKNGNMNGAQIAEQFIFSAEMLAKNLSNEEFVNILYRAMMGREADAAGRTGWVNELSNGYLTRSEVTKAFVESTEFTNICSEYGITRGTYDASMAPIEHFVTRFYTLCLERNADQTGLYGWVNNLKNQYMNGAQIADAFIFSDEFVNKNVSDEKYVELLYNTLLGRPSDANGKAGWVGELQNGKMNRKEMMKAFIESTEFTGICEKYGITRGTVE